jgi:hypothetical protein
VNPKSGINLRNIIIDFNKVDLLEVGLVVLSFKKKRCFHINLWLENFVDTII